MMRTSVAKSFDLAAWRMRARGLGHDLAVRTAPLLRKVVESCREDPRIAKALDAVAAGWARLVEEFCRTIDPLLLRVFPTARLVAVLTATDDIELIRVEREEIVALGPLSALDAEQREHRADGYVRSPHGEEARSAVPNHAAISTARNREPSWFPTAVGFLTSRGWKRDCSDLGAAPTALAATRWGAIELRLRPDQVLRRSLSLPAASRDFLDPIIAHRLERLTPWRSEDVAYGYRVTDDPAAPNAVAVALVAASKATVEAAAARLAALGLAPTAVGLAEDGDARAPLAVALRRAGAPASTPDSRRVVSRVALAAFAGLGLLWAGSVLVGGFAADGQEASAARLVKARRLLKSATLAAVSGPERTLLLAKQPERSTLVLVDKLAQAIPQDTYLHELAATPGTLRLAGTSGNAPALIGRLEALGLANVRFSAAVTRGADQRDSFEITADRAGTPADAEASR